mgnify:FL=1
MDVLGFSLSDAQQWTVDNLPLMVDVHNTMDSTVVTLDLYSATSTEDELLIGTLSAEDPDILKTNPFSSAAGQGPDHGTVSWSYTNEGTINWTYNPNDHYHGPESFTVAITDTFQVTTLHDIAFNLTQINDPIDLVFSSPTHELNQSESLAQGNESFTTDTISCLLYTSPSPRDP